MFCLKKKNNSNNKKKTSKILGRFYVFAWGLNNKRKDPCFELNTYISWRKQLVLTLNTVDDILFISSQNGSICVVTVWPLASFTSMLWSVTCNRTTSCRL